MERLIKHNILIGNLDGAIQCALKCGRAAEALLLARSSSDELFDQTAKQIFVASHDSFTKGVLKGVTDKKYIDMAATYDLHHWKEMACICLNNNAEGFQEAMNIFGGRFLA